jgi:exosortase
VSHTSDSTTQDEPVAVFALSRAQRLAAMLPITLVVLALAWLVFIVPYAAGYGDYRRTIFEWLLSSWRSSTWQHGALAAPIAAFLVWRRRGEMATLKPEPSVWGLALALVSLVLFWGGYRGNFYYLGYASIQLLIAAMVLWLWGWRCFWRVGFAWLVLCFAWPYLFLEDTLAFKLRHIMVTATARLLDVLGVSVIQDGTRLISAATEARAQGVWFNLNVDGPCSGLRSLFALMMVGALFGYFRQRSAWRRALLFALSVPLAVLANMVRILVLIVGSMVFGMEFAVGRGEEYTSNFHLLTGVFVFVVSLGGLVLAEKWLNKLCGREKPEPIFEG